MKRFATSILVAGLVAAIGTASAQTGYYPNDSRGVDDRYDNRGDDAQPTVDRYGSGYGLEYDTARVIRVDPVIEPGYSGTSYGYGGQSTAQPRCYTRQDGVYAGTGGDDDGRYGGGSADGNSSYSDGGEYRSGSQAGRGVATVIGGIVGAALGSRVGGGNARYATAALGTLAGGAVGQQIYDNNNRYATSRNGSVTVCDPVSTNAGYDNGRDDARIAGYDVTYEYAGRRYTTRTDYNPGDTIRVRVDVRAE